MRILHVVHDFLPLHVAGVEVYTDHVARHMARDHAVALLYSEAVPEAPDYALRRGWHGAIRTYEIVNNHRFRRFEETYRNPLIDGRIREVLDEFRPDVVHVQHLLNLSVGLISELGRRGLPVVMTLHDHWLACANGGQRFHPQLGRCDSLDAKRCGSCTTRMNGLAARRPSNPHPEFGRHLSLAQLDPREVHCPGPEHVYLDERSYGPGRRALVAHPPTRLRFRVVTEAKSRFLSEIAMHPDTFEEEGGAVRFRVLVDEDTRIDHVLDPKRRPLDRESRAIETELSPGAQWIELRTDAIPSERIDYCTAAWVDPRVTSHAQARMVAGPWERAAQRVRGPLLRLGVASQTRRVRQRWQQMRVMSRDVSLFLAPSRYLGEELVRFGLPADRVVHCDYGFAVDEFRRRELPDRCRRFVFLGSLVRHKGVHLLLDAFAGLPEDAILEIYGTVYDPAYGEELRCRVAHPGVHFMGGITPGRVPGLLEEVDCLVVPSIWHENSPLTIHEAFLAGVPVVASRMGGHVELLSEGGGLLYDADDSREMRRQLQRLYDEPGLGRRLAESSPSVKSLQDHVHELLGFYEKLLPHRGRVGVPA